MALGLASATSAPQVPTASVVLTGGPEGGSIKAGSNFLLTCSYNATYPGVTKEMMNSYSDWTPHIEFWHHQELLGAYKCKCADLWIRSNSRQWKNFPK